MMKQTKIDELMAKYPPGEQKEIRVEMEKLLGFSTGHINKRRKLTWEEKSKSFTNYEMLLLSRYWTQKLGKATSISDLLNITPKLEATIQKSFETLATAA